MIQITKMGVMPDGREVRRFTLVNERKGAPYAEISALGGCLMRLYAPDHNGVYDDVVLAYDTVDGILNGGGYMGCLIGRYANRIGGAAFSLNGKAYRVGANEGANMLHGGFSGFNRKLWRDEAVGDELVLSVTSPDGEEGFPGKMDVRVRYRLTDDDGLSIAYEAVCDSDTVINLTNHAYFNLEGRNGKDILDHVIQIDADSITAVADAGSIPTGEFYPVAGTPLDLRSPVRIGDGIARKETCEQMIYGNGFDHNYVLNPAREAFRLAARVAAPESARIMEVWTDQPGVQFYTGNFMGKDTIPGKYGKPYAFRQGLCLETQHFPDSPNHPCFPSVVLRAGETFRTRTEYRFACKG